jgi:hypothetical protein
MIYTIQIIIMLTALPIIAYLTVNQAIKLFSFGLDTKTMNKEDIIINTILVIFVIGIIMDLMI